MQTPRHARADTPRKKRPLSLSPAELPAPPTNDDVMLSTDQLRALTSTGGTYWYGLRLKGGGPRFFLFGRNVRYRWGDVKAWMQGNARISTSDDGAVDRAA